MMVLTYVDDDRNDSARRSLRLALSSAFLADGGGGAEAGLVVSDRPNIFLLLLLLLLEVLFFPLGQSEAMVLSSHLRSLFGDRGASGAL